MDRRNFMKGTATAFAALSTTPSGLSAFSQSLISDRDSNSGGVWKLAIVDNEGRTHEFMPQLNSLSDWTVTFAPKPARIHMSEAGGIQVENIVFEGPGTITGAVLISPWGSVVAHWGRTSRITLYPNDTVTADGLQINGIGEADFHE